MGIARAMHWTTGGMPRSKEGKGGTLRGCPHTKEEHPMSNDVLSTEVLRHGAYLCLSVPPETRRQLAGAAIPALAARLGLRNEFEPGTAHPPSAVGFLRRVSATPGAITDDELLRADAVVHVAAAAAAPVAEF